MACEALGILRTKPEAEHEVGNPKTHPVWSYILCVQNEVHTVCCHERAHLVPVGSGGIFSLVYQ